ncbi:hypothetical protein E9993_05430 [Labilibacter sediminis]|nr:hypothetical protein E9993_05430 [Labilibacter sediminis]
MEKEIVNNKYYALFVTQHLYFIPQFYPIAKELQKRNENFLFLLMGKDLPFQNQIAEDFCLDNNFKFVIYDENAPAIKCKYMINGGNKFPVFPIDYQYSVSVVHGIGTKAGYYTDILNSHDIRFIEGQKRVDTILELFPDTKCNLFNVGFAKLDTAINLSGSEKEQMFKQFNLDTSKKTILYAPTFYPSSIENMPLNFPEEFKEYNIIIKPHFFSLQRKKYIHQYKKMQKWNKYNNVYFAQSKDFDLCPFLAVSDIMISDESSAIFEFAALNKPVILNKNVRYRLSYRIFKWKIKKRLDSEMNQYRKVGTAVDTFKALKYAVEEELKNPAKNEKYRKEICDQIVGQVDGKVSVRIADILEKFNSK